MSPRPSIEGGDATSGARGVTRRSVRKSDEAALVSDILNRIGSRADVRIWRNNTGAYKDKTGRVVRYGLVGSADILGLVAPTGRMLAIEVKALTKQTEQQARFQAMIERMGGVYVLARSVGDVLAVLP